MTMTSNPVLDCFVGIDLGSTTTKSVIVDDRDRIIGRGITNSRSNYDIACHVSRTESFINARFSLFRQALEKSNLSVPVDDVVETLEVNFKREQYASQLVEFRKVVEGEIRRERFRKLGEPLREAVASIHGEMERLMDEVFTPPATKGSDFFRDIAGSHYARSAEEVADPRGVNFDTLMSIFDKCILQVENHAIDLSFSACIDDAYERTVHHLRATHPKGFGEEDREALAGAVGTAVGTELRERNSVGTGYGRARLPFPKQQIRSEILCHGLGAHHMFPETATVLDIGGQDTKAIQVDEAGIVTSFQMNDRCAAGCGRYLGYIADEMNLGVHELGPLARSSSHRVKINSTCTVFAGAELRDRLSIGQKREDILAGLHRAIVLRAMSLLARSGGIRNEFTFTGGVANNVAAVDAVRELVRENYGEVTLNISPDSIFTGALGAAIFARRDGEGVILESGEGAVQQRRSA
jgi:benzoyl-CoA reductase subunit A